jgi:Major Facilitator Superfamily
VICPKSLRLTGTVKYPAFGTSNVVMAPFAERQKPCGFPSSPWVLAADPMVACDRSLIIDGGGRGYLGDLRTGRIEEGDFAVWLANEPVIVEQNALVIGQAEIVSHHRTPEIDRIAIAARKVRDAAADCEEGAVRIPDKRLIGTASSIRVVENGVTANSTLGMPARIAFGATAVIGLCGVVCDPLGGWLSDKIGRKPVMIIPWLCLAFAVFPCFRLLERERSSFALYVACAVLACASTLAASSALIAVNESLPHRVRSGAFGLIYALSISIFGGSAQFIVAWLTRLTGNPLAPAYYMIGGVIVGLLAQSLMPESAPIKVGLEESRVGTS